MTDMSEKKPERVVIVGGGSAGQMAAALLGRQLIPLGIQVIQVQPVDGPGIGVGEATIPSVHRLLDNLAADEQEMMRFCHATFKLGIQFSGWHQKEKDYWHPFGVCGAQIDKRELFPYWLAERFRGNVSRPYQTYSLQWAAALAGKSPHTFGGDSPITSQRSYAFHLDANRFAEWLGQRAVNVGVKVVTGSVIAAVNLEDDSGISHLVLDDGRLLEGDLYIDCTGFEQSPLSNFGKNPFIDWSDSLLCNRAVAVGLPARREVRPFTRSTALSSGWAWTIPLAHRTGFGYVYDSQALSEEDALRELLNLAHTDGYDSSQLTGSPRHLDLKVGRFENAWRGNVVSVGLAAGFIEPLESTALHLTQVAIELFLELFPLQEESKQECRDIYNRRVGKISDEAKDFVQLHYHLSERDDSEFWKAARRAPISDLLQMRLQNYEACGWCSDLLAEAFPAESYFFILSGNNKFPSQPSAVALSADADRIGQVLRQILDQNGNVMRDLPLHEEILDWIHGAPKSETGRLF